LAIEAGKTLLLEREACEALAKKNRISVVTNLTKCSHHTNSRLYVASFGDDILNFAYESDKPVYKATMNGVATALRVRPVYLERQPRAQRHVSMAQILSRPGLDTVSGGLIRAWLVQKHKAMLIDFLHALGIQNKDASWTICPRQWRTKN